MYILEVKIVWSLFWLLLFLLPFFLTVNFIYYRKKTINIIKQDHYAPYVSILLPFKELDYNFEKTIDKLLKQNYPGEYEILFVTSEVNGEAKKIVEGRIKGYKNARLILAAETKKYRSDKVNNLLTGINNASKDVEVYAVIDSDIIPYNNWLFDLVQPLKIKNCGISSGTAWITAKQEDFMCKATRFWDFLATAQMTFPITSFARGFSMAFRKATFDKIGMKQVWENAFHDNLTLTDVVKNNNLKIYYSPNCIVSHCFNIKGWSWISWVRRQSLNTRINYNKLWRYGFFLITMPRLVGAIGFLFLLCYCIVVRNINLYAMPFLLWPVIHLLSSYFLIAIILPERDKNYNLNNSFRNRIILSLQSFASVFLCLSSLLAICSKKISWRGLIYHQKSPFGTTVINNNYSNKE